MKVEIQFGKTLPGPEDPTADQTPVVVDGIFVEASHHGFLEPEECRAWAKMLTDAANAIDPPAPEAPAPTPEEVRVPAPAPVHRFPHGRGSRVRSRLAGTRRPETVAVLDGSTRCRRHVTRSP